ncbi:MAG: radical SAM protein [Candidatus Schekmanbacteria bacterium]|nr:MAG: radical SAM protein [Candidatus Schekmanbacteria bacterium]
MEAIFVILNSQCTKECPYCFYNTGHQKKRQQYLTTDSIMSFISPLKMKGLQSVILTGGEPLLFKELPVLIENLAREGLYSLLITNGDLLTDEKIDEITQKGISSISVSLHIEKDDEHLLEDKMFTTSSKISLPLTFIFTLTIPNYKLAGKAVKIAKKLGRGLILQHAFIPHYSKQFKELSLRHLFNERKDLFKKFREEILEWSNAYNCIEYANLFLSFFSGRKEKPQFCPMGTDIMVLNCDGKLVPCFHREDLHLGNIFNDDISSIVENRRKFSNILCNAECFGEHCVSLFA